MVRPIQDVLPGRPGLRAPRPAWRAALPDVPDAGRDLFDADIETPVWDEPTWVCGLRLPGSLHYHPGHTWARVLDDEHVRVGLDDFAAHLLGRPDALELPAVGDAVRQGESACAVLAGGARAELLAPVEGVVTAVNTACADRPGRVVDDPYGRGWLYEVRCARLAPDLRNLLTGSVARRWLEDCRRRLDRRLMALTGSVLVPRGAYAAAVAIRLDAQAWAATVRSFLLAGA